MSRLDCAPCDSGLDWQRALISKVIPSISVMLGYEALHAATVESPQGVVAIMAPSGAGKSTLALELPPEPELEQPASASAATVRPAATAT